MAGKRSFLSRIRLKYHRSSPLLKCIVLAAVVFSTVCLLLLRSAIIENQKREEAARQEAAKLEQENQQIEEDTQMLGTLPSIIKIAIEKLGMMWPDDIRFLPNE